MQHHLRMGAKAVQVYFGNEQQSALGGLPLLGELELAEGLISGAAAVLRDWRVPGQISFILQHLMLQRVLLICGGFEDGIDSNFLANDPAVQMALSIGLRRDDPQVLASQATICRFENDFGLFNCYRLAFFLLLNYVRTHKRPPKSIRLDFDGSCIRTRGEQEGTTYRKHYETKMYFPLFVFDQNGFLITIILRPGSDGEAELVVPVLKRIVRVLRQEWPRVDITVVMDSAFNDPKIYDWCEDNRVQYLIKLKATGKPGGGLFGKSKQLATNAKIAFVKKHGQPQYVDSDITKNSVETEIRNIKDKKERKKKFKDLTRRVVRFFDQFEHRTGKGGSDPKQWRQDRRVLVVCAFDDWGEHRSFFVTNIVGRDPQYLIEQIYSQRGTAELYIKDAKAFRCDKLSCQQFAANQTRLLLHVLAYQLMYKLRSLLPKSMQNITLDSLKDRFIRIPVIIKEGARTTALVLSHSFAKKNCMHALLARLTAQHANCNEFTIDWYQWCKPPTLAPTLPKVA